MSQPLDYSNLPPPRPKPQWVGAPIVIAIVVSAFAHSTFGVYREQGFAGGERAAMWLGLVVCLGCLLVASVNLVRGFRVHPANGVTAVYVAGIVLGLVLVMSACSEVYRL